MRGFVTLILAFGALLLLSGCAVLPPWEKEILAREDMAWAPDPLQARLDAHIFFSKEASLPGGGAGGGGCGCN
ncbi:MAG: DUF4266 domain-containing protein [Deltaproteobacteria bacterium]|nr:DUF4266 domain-containing protein [Deltaproteobacteria bacterium]MBW2417352.1 DUF4266 domain-containing protein [Deltaproteobacteria bacterium]